MADNQPFPHDEGLLIAERALQLLDGTYERAEVVGSVRRGSRMVHDVELLITPRFVTETVGLFSEPIEVDLLAKRCAELLDRHDAQKVIWGPRLKRMILTRMPNPRSLELFIMSPPSQWGLGMVIRTGPHQWSHQFMIEKGRGYTDEHGQYRHGLMKRGHKVHDLGIHTPDGRLIETPEEQDVFDFLGIPYIEPGDRR